MYIYMSSLGKSDLVNLTKAELLQDLGTATIELRHSRHAYDIERHETMLGDVIGELNRRFAGWQKEYYQQPAAEAEQPYEKEFMTCSVCHKYKGCWSDSEVCSDCDEAEDERKMAENEALMQVA